MLGDLTLSSSHWCLYATMATWPNASFPSFQDHRTSAAEDSEGPGNSNPGGAHLAHSGVVLRGTKNAHCHTQGAAATEPDASPESHAETPSNKDEIGCHDVIRHSLKVAELSDEIISIISKSWREGAHKQYHSYLTKWVDFCNKRKANIVSATVKDFLEILYYVYTSQT